MSLLLARNNLLRHAPSMARPLCSFAMPRPALAPSSVGRRAFRVKAFKEDEGEKKEASVAKRDQPGAPMRQRDAAAVSPFRMMNSMMNEMQRMQREFDSLFGGLGGRSAFDDMLFRPFDLLDRMAPSARGALQAAPGATPGSSSLAPFANMPNMMVPVEVEEDDKQYTIHAEVPGFSKEHVKVTLSDDGVLTISGEVDLKQEQKGAAAGKEGEGSEKGKEGKAEARQQPEVYSRTYRSFTRSFRLPEDVQREGIAATTKHGLLTITVPKAHKPAPPPPKEIPIAAAE